MTNPVDIVCFLYSDLLYRNNAYLTFSKKYQKFYSLTLMCTHLNVRMPLVKFINNLFAKHGEFVTIKFFMEAIVSGMFFF